MISKVNAETMITSTFDDIKNGIPKSQKGPINKESNIGRIISKKPDAPKEYKNFPIPR